VDRRLALYRQRRRGLVTLRPIRRGPRDSVHGADVETG
jgi:hypothetical protein